VWDQRTHTCLATLAGHSSSVYALALVSPTVLASASDDKTIKLWQLTD
jgi:WD40 repeat protein